MKRSLLAALGLIALAGLIAFSSQAACSFDPKEAGYETRVLEPGRGMTVATVASEAGFCGSILLVAIDTDKGSADYNIEWR